MIWITGVGNAYEWALFGVQQRVLAFQHRGDHVVGGTCRKGESMIKVPHIADAQQEDTEISAARGTCE